MRTAFAIVALLSLLLAGNALAVEPTPPPSVAVPPPTAPNIHIASCKVITGQPLIGSAFQVGLGVRFTNEDASVYKLIVWRAKLGAGYVDFIDDGEFSPQIKIDNYLFADIGKAHVNIIGFLLMPRGGDVPVESEYRFPEYASLGDPENCQIIKTVKQDDEQTWLAPNVAQEPHYLLPKPAPSTEATLAPGEEDVAKGPVDIAHCHVLFFGRRNAGQVDVGFRSISPSKKADKVTFRVNYGRGNLDAVDDGVFEDGAYVRHKLKVDLPDELGGRTYFAFDDPSNCVAVAVHYSDGTTWTNPSAPAPLPVPTKVPDELDRGLTEWDVNWHRTQGFPAPTATPEPTVSSPAATNSPSPRSSGVTSSVLK